MNPMRTKLIHLSLATRVMLGAMAIIFVAAIALTGFVVRTDRETYLADRGAVLANGVARNAERLGRSVAALRREVGL